VFKAGPATGAKSLVSESIVLWLIVGWSVAGSWLIVGSAWPVRSPGPDVGGEGASRFMRFAQSGRWRVKR
jgi:hypothetical protein